MGNKGSKKSFMLARSEASSSNSAHQMKDRLEPKAERTTAQVDLWWGRKTFKAHYLCLILYMIVT